MNVPIPDPPAGYRNIPSRLNIARELVDRIEEKGLSDRTAFAWDGGKLTYRELANKVKGLSANLSEGGVRRNSPVLIFMHNCQEFAVAVLALFKLGALPVLLNSSSSKEEVAYVVDHSTAFAAITFADHLETLPKDKLVGGIFVARGPEADIFVTKQDIGRTVGTADTSADDPAFMVYSSGTTGRPKGIVHGHRWLLALGDANRYRVPPEPDDRILATGEWSFISALGHNVLFPLRNGNTGVILEDRPSPARVLRAIQDHRVTLLYSVATVYRRLLTLENSDYDLESLRGCSSTGEALETATWHQFKDRFGCEIWEHYGVSEMQMVMGQGPRFPVRPGSVGRPAPGTVVEIADESYQPVADGTIGHVLIRSDNPGFFLGYHRDPGLTRKVMHDGWYHTGDLGYRDADGYFWIAGRSDDCFKSRGIFISPYEIENALRLHPAIAEACVVPVKDADIGNRIRAACVLRDTDSRVCSEEVFSHLRARLASYKVPHELHFVESLPKSPVGKVLRREIEL